MIANHYYRYPGDGFMWPDMPKIVGTCPVCGKFPLHWHSTGSGWVTMDTIGTIHACKQELPTNQINMQNIHYIQSIYDDTIKTVSAKIGGSYSDYVFKTRLDLEVDDVCLASISSDSTGCPKDQITAVTVTALHEIPDIDADSQIDYKWIFQKVDTELSESLEKEDADFRKKARELIRKKHREAAKADLGLMLDNGKPQGDCEEA